MFPAKFNSSTGDTCTKPKYTIQPASLSQNKRFSLPDHLFAAFLWIDKGRLREGNNDDGGLFGGKGFATWYHTK